MQFVQFSPNPALKPQNRIPQSLRKIVLSANCLLECCSLLSCHTVNRLLQRSSWRSCWRLNKNFLRQQRWRANSGFPSHQKVEPGFLGCPLMNSPGLPGCCCWFDKPSSLTVHGHSFPVKVEKIKIRCKTCHMRLQIPSVLQYTHLVTLFDRSLVSPGNSIVADDCSPSSSSKSNCNDKCC